MKNALLSLVLFLSTSVMAGGICYDEALESYHEYLENHETEFLAMFSKPVEISYYYNESYESFSPENYPKDSLVYEGQSNYWGGVGVHAIVMDPSSCANLGVDLIYAE